MRRRGEATRRRGRSSSGRIADKQAKIYEALEVRLASVAELMPPVLLPRGKGGSWVTGARAIMDWQAKTMKIVERLWYEEDSSRKGWRRAL